MNKGIASKRIATSLSMTAVLLSATACGGDKGADSAGAEPLTQAKLSSAALAQGDVPGYTISETTIDSGASARAAKKSCQPIVNAVYPAASAYDGRLVGRSIVNKPGDSQKPIVAHRLILSSAKSESAAEQSVKDLKSAITTCGSGFDTNLTGPTKKIRTVKTNESSLGHDVVDFSLEYQTGRKIRFVVVQSGASLASISAEDRFAHRFVAVPKRIVEVQQRKLDKAAT
ncbi:hypothetical protein [Streptomyces sp. NRRL S-920]|uniref:hypothetical protein n=1 Tax=Streptomyces sp. NRRL S-920 TaxID=1463921 RepID=UPI00131CBC01|nr:hypothetical protein [Streptomyces sp. NRRL S-920]